MTLRCELINLPLFPLPRSGWFSGILCRTSWCIMTPMMIWLILAVDNWVRCSPDAALTYNDGVTIDRISGVSGSVRPDFGCSSPFFPGISGCSDGLSSPAGEPEIRSSKWHIHLDPSCTFSDGGDMLGRHSYWFVRFSKFSWHKAKWHTCTTLSYTKRSRYGDRTYE